MGLNSADPSIACDEPRIHRSLAQRFHQQPAVLHIRHSETKLGRSQCEVFEALLCE